MSHPIPPPYTGHAATAAAVAATVHHTLSTSGVTTHHIAADVVTSDVATSGLAGVLATGAVDGPLWLAVKSLPEVINGLQTWIMGILAGVATLYLVIGGLRYVTAGGDPGEVEKAKGNLKSALLGYALAALAPILLQALQKILGV